MNIVFCAAEASPFAKVGGLGDVVGSLPKALAGLGEKVIICLPRYGCIAQDSHHLFETGIAFSVSYGEQSYHFRLLESTLPQSSVTVYFFENEALFGRFQEVYPVVDVQFASLRYEVFGEAVFHFLKQLGLQPDVLHLHDWHTANIAVSLQNKWRFDTFFSHTASVLTLHNLAYQGIVNDKNPLKEGLIHSDALVAVSPTYAREILTPTAGAGLEEVVRSQQHKLHGILNGLDTALFNPATDVFIPKQYDVSSVKTGKQVCKTALQMEMGLPLSEDTPVIGMVSRLVEQKGLDILLEALPLLAQMPVQLAILGSGDARYEESLKTWNTQSENVRSLLGFHAALGQHIYAGADLFLMPSRFEPCGLGQMIALHYGTIPVVRQTGGLGDTVWDITTDPERGNGFVFAPYSAEALIETVQRALTLWREQPTLWQTMIQRGMQQDFSWRQSALAYQQVYLSVSQQVLQRN